MFRQDVTVALTALSCCAGSDAGTQRPASEKQAAQKGASKKKQKPGKKAAKAAATASGGQPESPAVEFLVANEAYQEQGGIVMQGGVSMFVVMFFLETYSSTGQWMREQSA